MEYGLKWSKNLKGIFGRKCFEVRGLPRERERERDN